MKVCAVSPARVAFKGENENNALNVKEKVKQGVETYNKLPHTEKLMYAGFALMAINLLGGFKTIIRAATAVATGLLMFAGLKSMRNVMSQIPVNKQTEPPKPQEV